MTQFFSDNVSPACPEVLEAIIAANSENVSSYGDDPYTAALNSRMSEVFERDLVVFPVVTGTASNALALSALTPSYGKVFCHRLSHINTDECAAPEFFSGGAKLIPLTGEGGKITAIELADAIQGAGNVHSAQPAAVSITQACETGEVYQVREIEGIANLARDKGLRLHMDGARFANALAQLEVSPADMTWRAGVDVLSFGGTKNGCLAAEAVVVFDPDLARSLPYLHKRSGQLLSKMRFISAQLLAYLVDDLWLRNARQANEAAARLSRGLAAVPNIEVAYPTQSNEVFVRIPEDITRRLRDHGYQVNDGELDGTVVRFVTAWNTSGDDVDSLLAAVRAPQ